MTSAGDQLVAGRIPGERIATSIETSNSSTFTSETDVMSVTASVVEGRVYKVVALPQFSSSVHDDLVLARLYEDDSTGTEVQRGYVRIRGSGSNSRGFLAYMAYEYTADATEDKTFVVTGHRLVGTGDIELEAASTSPNYLYVDYIRG